MKTRSTLLNVFPLEFSATTLSLPFRDYRTWQASTQALSEEYVRYSVYRYDKGSGEIRVILLSGPAKPTGLPEASVDLLEFPYAAAKLARDSFAAFLFRNGFISSRSSMGASVFLKRSSEFSDGMVDLFTGISFRVNRPFAAKPALFVVSINREVAARFRESVAHPSLTPFAAGMPVVYRPASLALADKELDRFRNRYIGRIHQLISDKVATVLCKDFAVREVPLSDLFLEGSPATLREYENHLKRRPVLVHKLQQLNFVLRSDGRRNRSVLRDRLDAISRMFGDAQLQIPLRCFVEATLAITLRPTEVPVTTHV